MRSQAWNKTNSNFILVFKNKEKYLNLYGRDTKFNARKLFIYIYIYMTVVTFCPFKLSS